MVADLLFMLGVSLGIQALFFAIAASLRTDKVTDLSYSLTFLVLALILFGRSDAGGAAPLALASMIGLWSVRLAGYLVYRVMRMGRDARFDGVRERFWKFLQFWFFQGIVVWTVMLPTMIWFGLAAGPAPWSVWMTAGAAIWCAGLVIESLADAQKFRHKERLGPRARWMQTGLWRYSQHPNYFGELLCWWGLFVFVQPGLGWWFPLALVGPLSITYVLIGVTGIPTLVRSAEAKWGDDPDYRAYRGATSLLIPWPPRG